MGGRGAGRRTGATGRRAGRNLRHRCSRTGATGRAGCGTPALSAADLGRPADARIRTTSFLSFKTSPQVDDEQASRHVWLCARLRAALRVRSLHATVMRRLVPATPMALSQIDPARDATVLLIGRGGAYPALSVALGERTGVVGALSIEAAAKHLNVRDIDGIVLGEGFSPRVIDCARPRYVPARSDPRRVDRETAVLCRHARHRQAVSSGRDRMGGRGSGRRAGAASRRAGLDRGHPCSRLHATGRAGRSEPALSAGHLDRPAWAASGQFRFHSFHPRVGRTVWRRACVQRCGCARCMRP